MNDLAGVSQPQAADFTRIAPGFAEPVHDAQACFRAILDATAHPGRIVTMPATLASQPPPPLGAAAFAVLLTLCDIETPVWLDTPSRTAAAYLAFHCGSPLTGNPGEARFAFSAAPGSLPALSEFALGTDEYPERSTTLLIEIAGFDDGPTLRLTGPGIRDEAVLRVAGVPPRFWTERAELAALFPRGIDVLLACGNRLSALPRSTLVEF